MIEGITAVGSSPLNPLRHISLIPQPASSARIFSSPAVSVPVDTYIRSPAVPLESATYNRASLMEQYRKMNADPLSSSYVDRNYSNMDASDRLEVQHLAARDQYVRIHEMRHAATLGMYAGRIHYNYQVGPDGKAYAVGGYTEVNNTPAPTREMALAQARTIRRAAMAAGEASGSDRAVAAQAGATERAIMAGA